MCVRACVWVCVHCAVCTLFRKVDFSVFLEGNEDPFVSSWFYCRVNSINNNKSNSNEASVSCETFKKYVLKIILYIENGFWCVFTYAVSFSLYGHNFMQDFTRNFCVFFRKNVRKLFHTSRDCLIICVYVCVLCASFACMRACLLVICTLNYLFLWRRTSHTHRYTHTPSQSCSLYLSLSLVYYESMSARFGRSPIIMKIYMRFAVMYMRVFLSLLKIMSFVVFNLNAQLRFAIHRILCSPEFLARTSFRH